MVGGLGKCERRRECFVKIIKKVKIKKKKKNLFGEGRVRWGSGWGGGWGQGCCERRIEGFMKIRKNRGGGVGLVEGGQGGGLLWGQGGCERNVGGRG